MPLWCEPLRPEKDMGNVTMLADNLFTSCTAAGVPEGALLVVSQQRIKAPHATVWFLRDSACTRGMAMYAQLARRHWSWASPKRRFSPRGGGPVQMEATLCTPLFKAQRPPQAVVSNLKVSGSGAPDCL